MSDLLLRGGTLIDGTGAPRFAADLRVRGGQIAEIAPRLAPAAGERVHDASGCFVAPGFIEAHTHFDGTMWWQPDLEPLPGYGVTTTILGNCGFSAAPVSDDPAARLEMVKIFSFFEDIPIGPFLSELPWTWRTWSEYQRAVTGAVRVPAHYGAFIGHIALRLAVLGLEAWERAATPGEIRRMAALLEDALAAGALGLSSNLMDHDGDDRPVPTLRADDAEFAALLDVLARHPATSLQIIPDTFMRMTGPESIERIGRLCDGRSVRVQWAGGEPTLAFQREIRGRMQDALARWRAKGCDFWTGFAHVSPTNTLSVNRSLIFAQSNDYVWHEVVLAETEAAKLALLADPAWRARARRSWDESAWRHSPLANPGTLSLLNSDNGVGPVGITLAEHAARLGVHASDAMAEWLIRNGLQSTVHMAPFPMDEELVVRLLKDPHTVGNISDAGAHGQMLCGAGENVLLFTKYVRELGVLTLEEAVHVQTGKLAEHFRLCDRGVLAVGRRADLTVFRLEELGYREMKKVFDVPDGQGGTLWRWTRDPAPVRLTLVDGVATFEDGRSTGARPGRMLRPALPERA